MNVKEGTTPLLAILMFFLLIYSVLTVTVIMLSDVNIIVTGTPAPWFLGMLYVRIIKRGIM